jgi:hypothetical protein
VSAEFTGRVTFSVAVLLEESCTVTLKVSGFADTAVPSSTPAGESVNPLGSPVADH